MQLSLPAATFPTPAAAPACGIKTPPAQTDSPDTPAESFDSLLKKDSPDDDSKDGDGKMGADAEQAAGTLAAILWMQNPVAATSVPVLPAVLTDGAVAPSATEGAGLNAGGETATGIVQAGTPFFGATNSRAFGKFQSIAGQVQATSSDSVAAAQVSTLVAKGQGEPDATEANPLTAQPSGATTSGSNSTSVTTDENPLNAPVLAEQVTANISGVTKLMMTPVGKVSAKNSIEGKMSAAVTEKAADPIADGSVVAVSSTGENLAVGTLAADLKADQPSASSLSADAQEKIAPLPAVLKDLEKSAAKAVEKYFLEPVQKAVTAASASVGIAVAKVNAVMSSAPSARTKSASLIEPSAAFVFSADTAPTATLTVDAPAPVATVRETLAAVISAVDAIERRADVQQKSVDLNFHVGNEKLGLRVELKDGAVHTTFRTESPEMNSALAREWHAVVPTAFAREVRLAEPVFHTVATSGSDSSSTSLGQGAQQQQREHQKAAPTFASALRREFADAAAQEITAPATSAAANSSQLLNALA